MKQKFTLLVLAALFVAVGTFAQSKTTARPLSEKYQKAAVQLAGKNLKQQPPKKSMQMQNSIALQKSGRAAFAINQKASGKTATNLFAKSKRASRRAAEIIYDQPKGEQVIYSRSGSAYYPFWGYIFETEFDAAVGNVVFGADNKVYIKNIISQYNTDSWVEGTLNGSKISFQFPQPALDVDGTMYYVGYGKLDDNLNFTPANGSLNLTYNSKTGDITTNSLSQFASGGMVLALIDGDGYIAGYCDWNINMTKISEKTVTPPQGLTTEAYSLSADGYTGSIVQVGFDGSDVYVQGIDSNLPDTWVKGTVSENKVTFKSGQYLGADEVAGYHQYLCAATAEEVYDPVYEEYYTEYSLSKDDIEFTYDAATKILSNSTLFMLNAGTTSVNYLYIFDKAKIVPFVEVAATPAAPTNLLLSEGGWDYYKLQYGWGDLEFTLPSNDVDGNYILADKMSYMVYVKVNGEVMPLALSWYDYIYQEVETMTEIPLDYVDNYDIGGSGLDRYMYYYIVGPEAFGVQSIYRGAGEERRSEITWVNVEGLGADIQPEAATPAYPKADIKDTDKTIVYGFYTGEDELNAITNNYKPETYDVAIKVDDPALVGSYIKQITFPLQEVEGVSDISVFLTSQLRVENGKNAADLVVKSVTPEEAGFITVELENPYLIPEDGVYVGYSLTVDNVIDYEINATPVAVTAKVNDDALYIHTSDGFLKWFEVSEEMGGSSLITVDVVGSNIMENAAVASGEQLYVKTGQETTIPVTVVNHGSNGLQSIEVSCSVAGKTSKQLFDVSVPSLMGASTTISLNVPAIDEKGNYDMIVFITSVNGVANEEPIGSPIPVIALNTLPKKRTLLEEYTGMWCGWCPRGYVAMEKLAKLYPDEYVLVSYHNADDLEIMAEEDFPSPVNGYPGAFADRAQEVEPYYGMGNTPFGIADALAERNNNFGMADIAISSTLNEEGVVSITSEITFPVDVTDGNYGVEYVLTADGLTNKNWGQSNYYNTETPTDDTEAADLAEFFNGESTVYGLVYNDVAVLTSEMFDGSDNTIDKATADTPVSCNYEFPLDAATNTSGNPIIQDTDKLKVIALLIDKETGEVVNANKAAVESATVGIEELATSGSTVNTEYHDLSGRKVTAPVNGIYVQTRQYKSGKTVNRKVVIK